MWRAVMETVNYQFEAFGASRGDAWAVLRAGLEEHAKQCDLVPEWWVGHYDVRVGYVAQGECYRSGELLRQRPTAPEAAGQGITVSCMNSTLESTQRYWYAKFGIDFDMCGPWI